jgi:hypothetical protein
VSIPSVLAIESPESDLPFGLQSGLFTARGVGYVAPLDLKGGTGLPWGLESGLVTAHLDSSGHFLASSSGHAQGSAALLYTDVNKFYVERLRVQLGQQRGIDADAARYQAMGESVMIAALLRGIDASSARYQAMGESFLVKGEDDVLAANPELMFARHAYSIGTESMLAANPELLFARGAYGTPDTGALVCNLAQDDVKLAANPELLLLSQPEAC